MKPLQSIILAILLALLLFAASGCSSTKQLSKPAQSSAAFVATESAKLHIAKARLAIERADTSSAGAALASADKALDDAGQKIESLQSYTAAVVDAKEQAEIKAQKESAAKSFWRGWALKLGALSAVFALWIFRKPLLALCGVPTF